ncbi:MAG: ATP-dependent Clp protease adaptor ClpS [Bacteroidota bacterium]
MQQLFWIRNSVEVEEDIDVDIDILLEEIADEDIGSGDVAELIIYNDDVNTFDWVIRCLMEILKYPSPQAEQLTLLIHFKGKATVKTAPRRELRPIKEALVDRGLSAVIEGGSDD